MYSSAIAGWPNLSWTNATRSASALASCTIEACAMPSEASADCGFND